MTRSEISETQNLAQCKKNLRPQSPKKADTHAQLPSPPNCPSYRFRFSGSRRHPVCYDKRHFQPLTACDSGLLLPLPPPKWIAPIRCKDQTQCFTSQKYRSFLDSWQLSDSRGDTTTTTPSPGGKSPLRPSPWQHSRTGPCSTSSPTTRQKCGISLPARQEVCFLPVTRGTNGPVI